MFSLNHSQNTLKQVKVTFTLPSRNKTYTGNPINEIIEVTPSYAVYSIKDSQGRKIKTNIGNGRLTGTELNMGVNNGENASYSIYPLGDENYTYVLDNQQFVTGDLTIGPATLTASTTTGSATYNGSSQSVTVISGINGTYSGSISVSGENVGSYQTTITGNGNYSGSVTGTLTIGPATLSASTISASRTYNGSYQTVTVISGINGTYSGSTSVSGENVGSYQTTITGNGNYSGSVTGTLTIGPAALTASTVSASRTYNGSSQSVTVISGINGTYSGSPNVSGTDVGSYQTTITGNGNYSGSVTGTLTIGTAPASSSPAYGTTIYSAYDNSQQSRVVIFNVSGLSYTGDTIVSGINVGTYATSITLSGNYHGTLTGYLVITEAAGFISLFLGDYIPNGNTNTVLFSRYLQSAVSTYVFTSSVSGPGAGDAYVQEGYGVQSTSMATAGFTVTLTATITDPNYTRGSATTTITFLGYTPPPDGGGISE